MQSRAGATVRSRPLASPFSRRGVLGPQFFKVSFLGLREIEEGFTPVRVGELFGESFEEFM
jgi:hypothetical protein